MQAQPAIMKPASPAGGGAATAGYIYGASASARTVQPVQHCQNSGASASDRTSSQQRHNTLKTNPLSRLLAS